MEGSQLNHYVANGNTLVPAVNFIAQATGNVVVNDNARFIQNASQFQPQYPIQYSNNNVALMNQDATFQQQYPAAFVPQGQVYYQSVIAYVANTRADVIPPTQFAYLVPCASNNSFPGPQVVTYPQNVTLASCNSIVTTNGLLNIASNSTTYNNYRGIGLCLAEGNDSFAGNIVRNDQQIAIRNEDCIVAEEGGTSCLETRRVGVKPNIGTLNEAMRCQAGPSENDADLEIVYESIYKPPERMIKRRKRKKKVFHRYVRRILPRGKNLDSEYDNEEIYEHIIDISTWNPPKTEIMDCDSPFPDIKPDTLDMQREPSRCFPITSETAAGTSRIKCEPLCSYRERRIRSDSDTSSIMTTIDLVSPIAETTLEEFEEPLENEPEANNLNASSNSAVASVRSVLPSSSEIEALNSSVDASNNSNVSSNDEAVSSFTTEPVRRNVFCEVTSRIVESPEVIDLSSKAHVLDYGNSNSIIPSTAANDFVSKATESYVFSTPLQNSFNLMTENHDSAGPLDLTTSTTEEEKKMEEDRDSVDDDENLMNFSAEFDECNFDEFDVFSDDTNLENIFTDFVENNYRSDDGGYTIPSEEDNSKGNFRVGQRSNDFSDSIEVRFPESIGIDALDSRNEACSSPFAHTSEVNETNSCAQQLSYGELNYTDTALTHQSLFGVVTYPAIALTQHSSYGTTNYSATALAQGSPFGKANIPLTLQSPMGETNLNTLAQPSTQSSFGEGSGASVANQSSYEEENLTKIAHQSPLGEANVHPPVQRLPVIKKNYPTPARQVTFGGTNVNSLSQQSLFKEANFARFVPQSPLREKNFTQPLSLEITRDYEKETEINIGSSEVIASPGEISNDGACGNYDDQIWNKQINRDTIWPSPNEPIALDSDLVDEKCTNDVEIVSQYSARKKRKSAFGSVSNMPRSEDTKPKLSQLSLQRMNWQDQVEVEINNVKHLRCYVCNLNFATVEEKSEHVNLKHDVEVDDPFSTKWLFARCVYDAETLKVECRLCNLSCPSIEDVFEHMVVDHGMRGLGLARTCPTCFSTFSTADEYKNHIKDIHQYECLICGRKTTCRAAYALHQKRHMAVRPYQCALCDKCFVTKQKLREHINGHTGYAPIKCNECGKSFKRYSNCYQHRQYCAGYKNVRIPSSKVNDFFCPFCNQLFHSRKKLRWHEELHEPPKKCSICLERFVHRGMLTRHQRMKHGMGYANSKTRLVECALCFKTYSKSSMINHVKSHMLTGSFFCTQCPKTFKSKCNLENHKWTHVKRINKPFQCKECKTGYVAESEYQAHLRSHKNIKSYSCNYCGRPFRRRYNCKRHIREHEEEPRYKCELCLKQFHRSSYLKDHMKTHTGERPHRCHICGKTSAVKSNHNKHMTTHMAKESDHSEE